MTKLEVLNKIHIEILGSGHPSQFKGGREGEYPIDKLFQVLHEKYPEITKEDIFDTALEYGGRECVSIDDADENGADDKCVPTDGVDENGADDKCVPTDGADENGADNKCVPTDDADENGDLKLCLSIIFYPYGDSGLSKKVKEIIQSRKKLVLGCLSEEDQKELIELCYREMERETSPCESTFDLTPEMIVAKWANIFIAPYDDALGLDALHP